MINVEHDIIILVEGTVMHSTVVPPSSIDHEVLSLIRI